MQVREEELIKYKSGHWVWLQHPDREQKFQKNNGVKSDRRKESFMTLYYNADFWRF